MPNRRCSMFKPVIAPIALFSDCWKSCCVVHESVDPHITRTYRRCGIFSVYCTYKFSYVFADKNVLIFQKIPVTLVPFIAMLSICDILLRYWSKFMPRYFTKAEDFTHTSSILTEFL